MSEDSTPEQFWWQQLAILYRKRVLIIVLTVLVAAASVVVSLVLPVKYKASSRLVLPVSGSGGIAGALLGDISSAAQSILGTGAGDYVRFLAILNSRTVQDSVVDAFDLIRVYELEESEYPREYARMTLAEHVDFVVDQEYDFLSVEVLDSDPERAAAMSNFYVGQLDQINNRIASQTASSFREYVDSRYEEAESEHQNLLDSLAAFQRRYGVYDLEAQTQAFFSQVAEIRAEALQLEIQYASLEQQFGSENRQVRNLASLLESANAQFEEILAGSEAVFPVDQQDAPDMVRRYLELSLQRTIQERILELVAPMAEQARFEEEKQVEALQIVDEAVAPFEKASPQRALICIFGTLSGFVIIIFAVLFAAWWKRTAPLVSERLREASRDV
jgi:capsule polysaccharide export protein KpsE/RkpR